MTIPLPPFWGYRCHCRFWCKQCWEPNLGRASCTLGNHSPSWAASSSLWVEFKKKKKTNCYVMHISLQCLDSLCIATKTTETGYCVRKRGLFWLVAWSLKRTLLDTQISQTDWQGAIYKRYKLHASNYRIGQTPLAGEATRKSLLMCCHMDM